MEPGFLTTAEVAACLGVSIRRVQALIKAKRLPAVKVMRDWVIAEADLLTVMQRTPGRPRKAPS